MIVASDHSKSAPDVRRTLAGAIAVLVIAALWVVGGAAPAHAAPSITASPTSGAQDGTRVNVSGSGFDTSKGIYVAFCVLPPGGGMPTPCGGGADMTGSTGASVWISDNPPPYGVDLARPFDPGGSFTTTITVTTTISGHDCRAVTCAVVTRADHLRTSDRTQDAAVPISFAAEPPPADPPATQSPSTSAPAPRQSPSPDTAAERPEVGPDPGPSDTGTGTGTGTGSGSGSGDAGDAASDEPGEVPDADTDDEGSEESQGATSYPPPGDGPPMPPYPTPLPDPVDVDTTADLEEPDTAEESSGTTLAAASEAPSGSASAITAIVIVLVSILGAGTLIYLRQRRARADDTTPDDTTPDDTTPDDTTPDDTTPDDNAERDTTRADATHQGA